MIRGVGYGPVGVVTGVFMMSKEYRSSGVIGGIAPGMFHVEHVLVWVTGRPLMFHVEHCDWPNTNRLRYPYGG